MKITKSQLKQIIKEELSSALLELEDYERRDLETGLAIAAGETPEASEAAAERERKDFLVGRIVELMPALQSSALALMEQPVEKLEEYLRSLTKQPEVSEAKITRHQLRRIIREELKEAGRSEISPDSPYYLPPSNPPPWLGDASKIIEIIKAKHTWRMGTPEDLAAHYAETHSDGDPDLIKFLTNYIWLHRTQNAPKWPPEGQ